MRWLVLVPIIDIVIIIIATIMYTVFNGPSPKGDAATPCVTPDNPPTPVETYTTQQEHPDLADQFDGRLTNIVKNPMKGIL